MKHSKLIAPTFAASLSLYLHTIKKRNDAMAQSIVYECYFNSAWTLNPKFDKRWKMGEDNLVVRDKFIYVLDGVGGWSSKGIDAGLMTKELVKYLGTNYDSS